MTYDEWYTKFCRQQSTAPVSVETALHDAWDCARSQALQEAAQVFDAKAERQKAAWDALEPNTPATSFHEMFFGFADEIRALAAQPAATKTVQAQRDERRIGWEDVLGWFEKWEPLINPTVDDIETAMKEAVKDARRYFSQPKPAATPACPNCGVTGKMSGPGTTALCMACGYTETTSPGAEPEGLLS